MSDGRTYRGACPWCDFSVCDSLNETFDDIIFHIRKEHYENMINYWIERKNENHRESIQQTKARVVQSHGVELIPLNLDEIECPFCDFEPEKYEDWEEEYGDEPIMNRPCPPAPDEETLRHIGKEHWDEFLEWTDETYMGFTLAMHEIAIDLLMDEKVDWGSDE